MKLKITHSTEAQRCENIAKLSKPNAPSKQALGREYEVSEGAIRKVWDNPENILSRTTNFHRTIRNEWFSKYR